MLVTLSTGRSREGESWHSEYGCWMIEGTPGFPYGDDTADLLSVEANMAERSVLREATIDKLR